MKIAKRPEQVYILHTIPLYKKCSYYLKRCQKAYTNSENAFISDNSNVVMCKRYSDVFVVIEDALLLLKILIQRNAFKSVISNVVMCKKY